MNWPSIFTVVWCCLIISACASNKPTTLKSLEKRNVKIEKQKLDSVSNEVVREKYQEFLNSAPVNHAKYSSVLSRLADLEMEAGDDKLFHEHEQRFLAAVKATKKVEDNTHAPGTENYMNAVRLYLGLLKTNPKDPRNDWVLYQLARAYEQSGYDRRSTKALLRLVTEYPRSQYLFEAFFRLGETYYLHEDYVNAEKAYQHVVMRGEHSVYYDRAVFKLGWSLYKQEKYNLALTAFFTALDRLPVKFDDDGRMVTSQMNKNQQDVLNDLVRVTNLSFSYANGVDSIVTYFQQGGSQPYELAVYLNLAKFYLDKDRLSDATDVYERFIKLNPLHRMSPTLQLLRVDVLMKGRFFRSALQGRIEFVERFGVNSQFWQQQTATIKKRLKVQLKSMLDQLTTYYHAQAQKHKREKDYQQAVKWYQAYVSTFADEPQTAKQYFLLGELLVEQKRYLDSIKVYEQAAYGYPGYEKANEAGYAAVVAYEKALTQLKGDEYIALRNMSVQSIEQFVNAFPKDARVNVLTARLADQFFQLKKYNSAQQYAKKILTYGDKVDLKLQRAAHIINGHVGFEQQDYPLAIVSYQQVLALMSKNDRDRNDFEERLAASIYKSAEYKLSQNNIKGAIVVFLQIAQLVPNSTIRPQADFDAATALLSLEQWEQALTVLMNFRQHYPKHKLQATVPHKLALVYEKLGRVDKAAQEYVRIAQVSQDFKEKQASLWLAAELYEKTHNNAQAIKTYEQYIKVMGSSTISSLEARNKLVELYALNDQLKKRRYWLKDMVKVVDQSKLEKTDRVVYLAAKSAFLLAEERFVRYQKVALVRPLKKNLRKKKKLMNKALQSYEKVLEYGAEEFTTAATYRVANIYKVLGAALLSSERPKGLSAEEIEEYDLLLEEQAYPFEEKAIQAHESNIYLVTDGVYNRWVKRSFTALQTLLPGRYAKVEQNEAVFEVF